MGIWVLTYTNRNGEDKRVPDCEWLTANAKTRKFAERAVTKALKFWDGNPSIVSVTATHWNAGQKLDTFTVDAK